MNEDENFILDEMEIGFQIEPNDESLETPPNTQLRNMKIEMIASGDTEEDSQDSKFAMKSRLQKKPSTSSSNASAVLLELSNKRTEYHERKLDLETQKYEKQLELENKKLLEEKRIDNEFKIRILDAEARKIEAENKRTELMLLYSSATNRHRNPDAESS